MTLPHPAHSTVIHKSLFANCQWKPLPLLLNLSVQVFICFASLLGCRVHLEMCPSGPFWKTQIDFSVPVSSTQALSLITECFTACYTFKTLKNIKNMFWIIEIVSRVSFHIHRVLFLHCFNILSHLGLDWIRGMRFPVCLCIKSKVEISGCFSKQSFPTIILFQW